MKKLILSGIAASALMVSCGPKSVAVTGPKYTSSEQLAQGKPFLITPVQSATNCRSLPNMTTRDGSKR